MIRLRYILVFWKTIPLINNFTIIKVMIDCWKPEQEVSIIKEINKICNKSHIIHINLNKKDTYFSLPKNLKLIPFKLSIDDILENAHIN